MKCWICGENEATTGEHKTKHSDLKAVFGSETTGPYYLHDALKPNQIVQSINAKALKSSALICEPCNSARTQPHDFAWEKMSHWLRNRRPALEPEAYVRCNCLWRSHTRANMLNVQLYFLKLFGCMLVEAADRNLPVDLKPFSQAIITGKTHPEVYLQFGVGDGTVGRSNLHCLKIESGQVLCFWLYKMNTIAVSVMYAQNGVVWPNLSAQTWHYRFGTSRIRIADFRGQGPEVPANN